jgi:hypothetical protein
MLTVARSRATVGLAISYKFIEQATSVIAQISAVPLVVGGG